jgi:hypothetical protein
MFINLGISNAGRPVACFRCTLDEAQPILELIDPRETDSSSSCKPTALNHTLCGS